MTVGGINSSPNIGNHLIGIGKTEDAYSKNLQQQIANAQKQLQELSKNNEMDPETKMKKRQELQKQISDLNNQLRQHQMEERRKAQQEKAQAAEEARQKKQTNQTEENMTGMSQSSMTAIVSAESTMKQAAIQGSTAKELQNTANITKAEIKLDGGRGGNTERKQAEAAELEAKSQETATAQMSTLAEANRTMSKAAEAESKDNNRDTNKKETDNINKSTGNDVAEDVTTGNVAKTSTENSDTQQSKETKSAENYTRIDVYI